MVYEIIEQAKNYVFAQNTGSNLAGSGVTTISGLFVRDYSTISLQGFAGNADKAIYLYGALWSGTQAGYVSGPGFYNIFNPKIWTLAGSIVPGSNTSALSTFTDTPYDFVCVVTSGADTALTEVRIKAKI